VKVDPMFDFKKWWMEKDRRRTRVDALAFLIFKL
jgi:hypothetical protein